MPTARNFVAAPTLSFSRRGRLVLYEHVTPGRAFLPEKHVGLDVTGIGSIADLLKTGIDKIWPDPAARATAQAALLAAQQAGSLKQLDDDFQLSVEQIKANAAEAAQPGLHFRDGAGWVCVAGFAFSVLKAPLEWAAAIAGHPINLPAVDTSVTTSMLLALLGLGGMHVYQQGQGVK